MIREFNDRGTLWLLEDPAQLVNLVRIIEPELAEHLDPSRADRVNRSFIPSDLRKQESDLIFRLPFCSGSEEAGEVWVYVLLEHQSRRDPLMPLRLYRYMGELWETQRREWEERRSAAGAQPLSPVIPLVFYTGEEPWSGPLQLSDLMEAPSYLTRFVPGWETLFLNLRRTTPETLTRLATGVGWALRALQAERAPLDELERVLREALSGLEGLPEERAGEWLRAAWYLLLLAFHRREEAEYDVLQPMIREQARQSKFWSGEEETAMGRSMAQAIEERALAAGEARAEARAEARVRRAVLEMVLQERFGSVPAEVESRLAVADADQLNTWLRIAATARALEDVGILD